MNNAILILIYLLIPVSLITTFGIYLTLRKKGVGRIQSFVIGLLSTLPAILEITEAIFRFLKNTSLEAILLLGGVSVDTWDNNKDNQ